jgi:hypothetical protein
MATFVDARAPFVPTGVGRLAIVVVFDEETTEQVPFVILAPGKMHKVIGRALNHYAPTTDG